MNISTDAFIGIRYVLRKADLCRPNSHRAPRILSGAGRNRRLPSLTVDERRNEKNGRQLQRGMI